MAKVVALEQAGLSAVEGWFSENGWKPFDFQRNVWNSYLKGENGLIHSATGTGKTFAAWLGPLISWINEHPNELLVSDAKKKRSDAPPLTVLWITPLRALASDTALSLQAPINALGIPWTVETRTGDTTASLRAKQKIQLPTCLVTTPESLTLMLTNSNPAELFKSLDLVVVDEWHELMASKRGVQTELALAHLRTICPRLRTWGVSATLGNLEEALHTLVGVGGEGSLVEGHFEKTIVIDSILPENINRFPWSGHFGTTMIPNVIEAIAEGGTCLVFCNTRSQCEIWFSQILDAKPEWVGEIALHHGSLDRSERDAVEAALKQGQLRAVVCTSSLDLGVDFTPVDRVLQVGSPKGVARLLQRAGRSGHRPGVASRVTCVPTHAFELIDIAASRDAALSGRIEAREGLNRPLDVLAQHLVSIAVGPGFVGEELLREVRSTHAYKNLSDEEWGWVLDFVTRGGHALRAYPEFSRVVERDGRYKVEDKDIAQRHRLSIGTIVSDTAISIETIHGARLGSVEESFIARLKKGDKFLFSGRVLEFVRMKDVVAVVKKATSTAGAVPRWEGGRLPLSNQLAFAIREKLEDAKYGVLESIEMQRLAPLLEVQARWSALPDLSELLVESVEDREGHHLFIYPLEGRIVHEGLAALFAYRISRLQPITFSMAYNDYGLELLSPEKAPFLEAVDAGLFVPERLGEELVASLNSIELAKRQFREIARVAGLVFQGMPNMNKTAKQLQASSGLFYDVFRQYDPENMLLGQAQREVLERQLDESRIGTTLNRLRDSKLLITHPPKPTPMAFPILVDRTRQTMTTENVSDRIKRMALLLETAAG